MGFVLGEGAAHSAIDVGACQAISRLEGVEYFVLEDVANGDEVAGEPRGYERGEKGVVASEQEDRPDEPLQHVHRPGEHCGGKVEKFT